METDIYSTEEAKGMPVYGYVKRKLISAIILQAVRDYRTEVAAEVNYEHKQHSKKGFYTQERFNEIERFFRSKNAATMFSYIGLNRKDCIQMLHDERERCMREGVMPKRVFIGCDSIGEMEEDELND